MNLLKQTSLILGLASLSIGVWTLYRNWKQKLALLFSALCLFISIWSLSFVSHATLFGRLSKDIHWFFHVWLVPIGVTILSKVLSTEDGFSRFLRWSGFFGAVILSTMIAFSLGSGDLFWWIVSFWPLLVLFQFLYVMIKDLLLRAPVNVDFFSPAKRVGLYFGLALSLFTCSFDHIPEFGFTVPAIGNLLLTLYLIFVSQMVTPQKFLNVPALAIRFFATLILSLVITGFFALLYQYMSESFPLFFLNSFLLTFAVLILWNPLITFFRYLGRKIFRHEETPAEIQMNRFHTSLPTITDLKTLEELVQKSFSIWMPDSKSRLWFLESSSDLPDEVNQFLRRNPESSLIPVIHRDLILMEKEQVVTDDLQNRLGAILDYLNLLEIDVIFPVYSSDPSKKVPLVLVLVSAPVILEEWNRDFTFYSRIFRILQEMEKVILKINQIENAKERDRLILLGEMAAGLAHEVRNPLSAIQGATELFSAQSDPWMKVIRDEVQRLNRLVNQFLDFAHDPGDLPEELNLGESLQRSIRNLSAFYGNQAEIQFVSFVDHPVMVMGVADHLQQILMNLIQNSLKANASRIEVVLEKSGFTVKDNGVGMSTQVKARVFQPFFTAFKTGSGLGLSICQRLVKFNQGEISIESSEGTGTRVTIKLCEKKSSSLMTNLTSAKS